MWGSTTSALCVPRPMARVEPAALLADADLRAAIKAYLRIETSDEDGLLDRLAAAATGHCEGFIGRLAIVRSVRETMPARCGGWQKLGASPARVVSGVEAIDPVGAATALAIGAYAIDLDAAGDAWLRIIDAGGAAVVRVTYTAGLASGFAALPEPIGQGIVRLTAHLFACRDAPDEGTPPAAVAALWRPWRRMRLA